MSKVTLATYHEELTSIDGHLEATEGAELQVLEVHRMGPDLKWRYVLITQVEAD